jgi:predicted lipid-binding transport protein (Tim44 family)
VDPACAVQRPANDSSTERAMHIAMSDRIIGGLMAILGLLGLFLAARAVDEAMYVFGLSLFAYACVFVIGQVRRHFDAAEAAGREAGNG